MGGSSSVKRTSKGFTSQRSGAQGGPKTGRSPFAESRHLASGSRRRVLVLISTLCLGLPFVDVNACDHRRTNEPERCNSENASSKPRADSDRQQEVAALNAEMNILTDLVRVFRESAHFDEEQLCLQKVRKLHRRIWFRRNKRLAPIYPFRWYVEFLLGSVPRFIGAIVAWVLGLTLCYYATSSASLMGALKAAFISFVAIQPSDPDPNFAVTVLAMLSGVTHLGIFISHLYSLIARK